MSVMGNLLLGCGMFGLAMLPACAHKTPVEPSAPVVEFRLWIAEPSEGYQAKGNSNFEEWREIKNGHTAKMLLDALDRNQSETSVGVSLFNTVCRPIGFVVESNGHVIWAGWYNNIAWERRGAVVVKYAQATGEPGRFRLIPKSRSSEILWSDLEGCLVNSDEWGKLELPSDF